MDKNKRLAVWLPVIIACSIALGVFVGNTYNFQYQGKNRPITSNNKMNAILDIIDEQYVDTVNMNQLIEGTIPKIFSELDPHSVYISAEDASMVNEELEGSFSGIGVSFNMQTDTILIISVISGGPAEKAGLQPFDRIITINDSIYTGKKTSQEKVIKTLRGAKNSTVRLGVKRNNEPDLLYFDVTRGDVPVHTVDAAYAVDNGIGYIKVSKFARTTYNEFITAIAKLKQAGCESFIIDLRNNTGGYMDAANNMINEFMPEGRLIVYTEGKSFPRADIYANGTGTCKENPIVVLTDEISASASEIFSGAIQDNDRGLIIGRRTYGKGLVQTQIAMSDGSALRLTIARYYTPSGRCIQKPYSDHYAYDIYERYTRGELTSADSIKVNTDEVYYTKSGRRVSGGGGIVPDVFVPMDTTRASNFYIQCNKKAVAMRFASAVFDRYRSELSQIEDIASLQSWMDSHKMDQQFLKYAAKQGLKPEPGEWEETSSYMMPQVNALVGRYSKLGEEAFYRLWIVVDKTVEEARKPHELC